MHRPDSRGSVTRVIAAAGLVALAVACSGRAKPTAYSIGVIPKGTTHEFWKAIHAGAVKAERELNAAGTSVTIMTEVPS